MDQQPDGQALTSAALPFRRAAEVLGEVLHEAQRRLALEAAARNTVEAPARRAKQPPTPFVDLTPYEGMSDRDVVKALGVTRREHVGYFARAVQRERSNYQPPEQRCEVGLPSQLGPALQALQTDG